MLAKIHLKTACGCTRTIFESDFSYPVFTIYRVPILATIIPFREPGPTPSVSASIRDFHIVDAKPKSHSRIELWYEETVYG